MGSRVLLLALVGVLPPPAGGGPLPAGKWLVDLGRDYPLSPQALVSDADAEITLLFMQAASRIEPQLAEAYRWQYDMLAALSREAEARRSLGEYVGQQPADVAALLNWVELTVQSLQTAEGRAEFCRTQLERAAVPKEVSGDLHRRLAEFHYNRGEAAAAESAASAALRDDGLNLAARALLDGIRKTPDTPVARIERLLSYLAVSPGGADAAWQLGDELVSLGMPLDADRWYQHAATVYKLVPPGTPPAPLLAAQARAGLEAGQLDEADRLAQEATELDANTAEAFMVRALLDKFPSQVLDYPSEPGRFVSLSLQGPGPEVSPGEPWWLTARLENTGPFPITFGQNMMLVPELLCSITARGDRTRTSGPTIRISLHGGTRLMPGECLTATQTIDIGRIHALLTGTPQVAHQVEVRVLLSPMAFVSEAGQEVWAPSVGGLAAEPVRFRRSAFVADPDEVRALILRSRAGDVDARIAATELLAMLLAEHQHLAARRVGYAARRIDAQVVQAGVLARARDADWHVRARLAECMRWFGLDKDATNTAAGMLRDPHWLVRGLTLRMLADQYGQKFSNGLERYAEADPDEWTRRLARALLERMNLTTRPAATRAAGENTKTQ